MSKKTSEWEKEFEKRFADFITSGLWYTPVREFIRQTVAKEKMELVSRIEGIASEPTPIEYMSDTPDEKYQYYKHQGYILAMDRILSALKSEEKEEVRG